MSLTTPAHDLDLRRSIPRELSALAALFVLTVRQHTHGRRLLVLGLLYALPCALAILLRSLTPPAPAESLEIALVLHLLPHGLAPLTALLYAAGVVAPMGSEDGGSAAPPPPVRQAAPAPPPPSDSGVLVLPMGASGP